MKEKTVRRYFIVLFSVAYLTFSFGQTRFTPFLSERGYDPFERGLVLSAVAVGTMGLQVLFGYLTDKWQTAKKLALMALALQLVLGSLLFSHTLDFLWYHVFVMGAYGGLCNTMTGQFDLWVLGINRKMQAAASYIRAFGSLGWAIGSLLAVYLVNRWDYFGLKWALFALMIGAGILMMRLPDATPKTTTRVINRDEIWTLLKRPDYILLTLTLFALYSLVVANNGIVIDKMLALGATGDQVSFKWSLQALVEIPMFFAIPLFIKKVRPVRLLQLSALVVCIQFIIYARTDSIQVLTWLGFLQMFTMPIITIPSKFIIARLAPEHLVNTAQMVCLSVYSGVSSLFIPTIVGYFSTQVGFDSTLLGLSGLGVLAMLGTICFDRIRV